MKKRSTIRYGVLLAVLACLVMGGFGCASMRNALLRSEVSPVLRTNTVVEVQTRTNTILEYQTNIVTLTNAAAGKVETSTNVQLVILTNVVPLLITNTQVQTQFVTNWTSSPAAAAVSTAANVALPGSGAAVMGGLSLWAAWLNRRNKSLAESTIAGIEEFRGELAKQNPEMEKKLVEKLQSVHRLSGVADYAAKTVNQVTR